MSAGVATPADLPRPPREVAHQPNGEAYQAWMEGVVASVARVALGDMPLMGCARLRRGSVTVDLPYRDRDGTLLRPLMTPHGGFVTAGEFAASQRPGSRAMGYEQTPGTPSPWAWGRSAWSERPAWQHLDEPSDWDKVRRAVGSAAVADGIVWWPTERPVASVRMRARDPAAWGRSVEVTGGLLTKTPFETTAASFSLDGVALRRFVEAMRDREHASATIPDLLEGSWWLGETPGEMTVTDPWHDLEKWLRPWGQRLVTRGSTALIDLASWSAKGAVEPMAPELAGSRLRAIADLCRDLATDDATPPEGVRGVLLGWADVAESLAEALPVETAAAAATTPPEGPRPRPTILGYLASEAPPPPRDERDRDDRWTEENIEAEVTHLPIDGSPRPRFGHDDGMLVSRVENPRGMIDGLRRYEGLVADGDDLVTLLDFADVTAALWWGRGSPELTLVALADAEGRRSTIADLVARTGDGHLPQGAAWLPTEVEGAEVDAFREMARDVMAASAFERQSVVAKCPITEEARPRITVTFGDRVRRSGDPVDNMERDVLAHLGRALVPVAHLYQWRKGPRNLLSSYEASGARIVVEAIPTSPSALMRVGRAMSPRREARERVIARLRELPAAVHLLRKVEKMWTAGGGAEAPRDPSGASR